MCNKWVYNGGELLNITFEGFYYEGELVNITYGGLCNEGLVIMIYCNNFQQITTKYVIILVLECNCQLLTIDTNPRN